MHLPEISFGGPVGGGQTSDWWECPPGLSLRTAPEVSNDICFLNGSTFVQDHTHYTSKSELTQTDPRDANMNQRAKCLSQRSFRWKL